MRLLDWRVWLEADESSADHIISSGPAGAACEYVQRLEQRRCDYSVARGDAEEHVLVAMLDVDQRLSAPTRFRVSAELIPHYRAELLGPSSGGES